MFSLFSQRHLFLWVICIFFFTGQQSTISWVFPATRLMNSSWVPFVYKLIYFLLTTQQFQPLTSCHPVPENVCRFHLILRFLSLSSKCYCLRTIPNSEKSFTTRNVSKLSAHATRWFRNPWRWEDQSQRITLTAATEFEPSVPNAKDQYSDVTNQRRQLLPHHAHARAHHHPPLSHKHTHGRKHAHILYHSTIDKDHGGTTEVSVPPWLEQRGAPAAPSVAGAASAARERVHQARAWDVSCGWTLKPSSSSLLASAYRSPALYSFLFVCCCFFFLWCIFIYISNYTCLCCVIYCSLVRRFC